MSKTSISNSAMLFFGWLLFAGNHFVFGQEFRDPSVQNPQQAKSEKQVIRGEMKTAQDFVPKTSNEGLGLIPIRPRTSSGNLRQYRPDYSGARSSEQERIIDKIRSDNFDVDDTTTEQDSGPQTIRQKYDNGKDQLVRTVIQDKDGNFYNHGPWRLYNRNGELVASGQFIDGAMDGTWERWHAKNSGGIFATKPFADFEGPFVSTATFTNGKLSGVWVISDRGRQKIVEVPYRNGQRHGTATWWYPSSERMRVVNFTDGALDGPMLEWNSKNELVRNDEFIRGQKVIRTTSFYRPKQRSAEDYYLDAELSLEEEDNWWDATPAEYIQLGSRVQHGPTKAWYSNGQQKMSGNYRNDARVGPFIWWHENGQKALAGKYQDGKKTGMWAWWHKNGMKAIEGSYQDNQPVGEWTWWDTSGNVSQTEDFGEVSKSSGILVNPNETEQDSGNTQDGGMEDESDRSNSEPPVIDVDQMEDINPFNTSSQNSENNQSADDDDENN